LFFKFTNNKCDGEPLWLSGKVVKINEIERTRVGSPPWATSLKIIKNNKYDM
jgi:hypothetical protein